MTAREIGRASASVAALLAAMVVPSLARAAAEGSLLVLNKAENSLMIVDPESLEVVGQVPTGAGPHEVATSADGTLAFVANYGAQVPGRTLSVIDLAARKELRRVDLGDLRRPHGIAVIDGKVYFTAEVNKLVARYDPEADAVDWNGKTDQEITHMLAVAPGGKAIYTANILSDSVSVLVPGGDAPPRQAKVGPKPEGIAVSPDGKEVWVGQNGDGVVSILDAGDLTLKERIDLGGVPIRVAFAPDGRRVLVSNPPEGELIVLEAATRKVVKRIPVGPVPVGILVVPDGSRAFVALAAADQVAEVDLTTLEVRRTFRTGKGPDGLAWAPRPADGAK